MADEKKSKPETKDSDSKPSGSGDGGKTATDGHKSSQVKTIASTDSTKSTESRLFGPVSARIGSDGSSSDSKKSTDGHKSSASSGSSGSSSSGSGAGAEAKTGSGAEAKTGSGTGSKTGSGAEAKSGSGAEAKAGSKTGSGGTAAATADNRCPICMDPIAEPGRGNQCNHRCCTACLQEWANQHANCPVCRQPITEIWTNIRADGGHDTRPVVRQNFNPFAQPMAVVPRRGRYRPPRPPPPVRNPRLNYHRLGYYWRRGVLCRRPRTPEEMAVARQDAWRRGRRSWRRPPREVFNPNARRNGRNSRDGRNGRGGRFGRDLFSRRSRRSFGRQRSGRRGRRQRSASGTRRRRRTRRRTRRSRSRSRRSTR